jgi:hypothetical protein
VAPVCSHAAYLPQPVPVNIPPVAGAGVVDFALLFVANYGNTRGKKYPDPTDVGHAVEMLRDVLGQVRHV